MCGIVGYIGKGDATKIGLACLKRLEYRGYDSFGICMQTKQELKIFKRVGKIGKWADYALPESKLAIFHSRWATHGGVTEANAHPHLSCNNKLAVVHNGIIENYQELKEELLKKGHVFRSETDTEVISHLLEEETKIKPMDKALPEVLKKLEGSYALLILSQGKEKIYAARNQSPLVIGIGKDEFFLASDIPAFLEYTNRVIFLEDGDYLTMDKVGVEIFNSGEKKQIKIEEVRIKKEDAELGPYKHFMLKEIFEQGKTLTSAINQEKKIIEQALQEIKKAGNVMMIACGTAYHAALTAAYHFAENMNKYPHVVLASELKYFSSFIDKDALIIAISQSGETADILAAIKEARLRGAKVISIVNVAGSTLTRTSDLHLLTNAGPEIAVASTKAFTSQVTLLHYLSSANKTKAEKEIIETEKKVRLMLNEDFCKQVQEICKETITKNLFIIGKGKNYPIALEAALKIKEISYIHAEGFAGAELKHGTLALIEQGTPCIVFANKGEREILGNAMEIKARGGKIIGISPEKNKEFDLFLQVPEDILQDLIFAIPAQLFAYYLGLQLNRDIDKPRNLAKSVTTK